MASVRTAITCDIDSTLADTRHRSETMINKQDRDATDWLAYAKACADDTPTDVLTLLMVLSVMHRIVLITARPEGARAETIAWLERHHVPYDDLIMDHGHYPSTTAYKVAAIDEVDRLHGVVLHIDDWWDIAKTVRGVLDIPTVVVRVYEPEPVETAS